jgi:hypothetical protein
MKAIQKITVSIRFNSTEIELGELNSEGRENYLNVFNCLLAERSPIFI